PRAPRPRRTRTHLGLPRPRSLGQPPHPDHRRPLRRRPRLPLRPKTPLTRKPHLVCAPPIHHRVSSGAHLVERLFRAQIIPPHVRPPSLRPERLRVFAIPLTAAHQTLLNARAPALTPA